MSAFADAYGNPTIIEPADGLAVVGLDVLDVTNPELGAYLSASVTLTLSADTTGITLTLKRVAPALSVLHEIPYVLPAVVVDPYTINLPIAAFDSLGVLGDAQWQLVVTPQDATANTPILASELHARYNALPLALT